ncbi:MAG TPA: extracellular solute-binding protein, partial [Solirubrobacteraceae bacterium]|nr:extracellular solute-binding protein [Solirubrobacteraceae bacterium]
MFGIARRRIVATIAMAGALAIGGGCADGPGGSGGGGGGEGVETAPSSPPKLPDQPVTLNVLDVAGNLQLTKAAIEKYQKENPKAAQRITFSTATAPELAGKVKAQQNAGRLNIDLVLTGTDGLAAGMSQGLWLKGLPDMEGLDAPYLAPAAKMQEQAEGQGVLVNYYPSGPLLEYAPDRVSEPPATPQALLAWAKDNPGKFMYARPSNSGPARTFLMGLPYLLGDKDPRDPINGWDKTWAYLKELGKHVEYYPSGTKDTMSGLADGSRDIIPTTTGWDINPRALGTVPKGVNVAAFDDLRWVTDAHYMVVPKGIAEDKLAVVADLMQYLLEPEQQAFAYDDGYFYPGPAIEGVGLDMAPEKSQKVIEEFGRPEYDELIESRPKETPLLGKPLVDAFDKWDREVGGSKV